MDDPELSLLRAVKTNIDFSATACIVMAYQLVSHVGHRQHEDIGCNRIIGGLPHLISD